MAKMCYCFSICLRKHGNKRLRTMSKKLVIAGDIIKKKFDMRTVLMQLQQMTKDHERMMRKLNLPLTSFEEMSERFDTKLKHDIEARLRYMESLRH